MSTSYIHYESVYHEVMEDFINTYKNEPCLWHHKNPEYYNRYKKHKVLDRMAAILRKLEPNADKSSVKRKINSIRTNYNKEMRKIEKSIAAGGPIHEPKLWYFKMLSFIDEDKKVEKDDDHILIVRDDGEAEYLESEDDEQSLTFEYVDASSNNEQDDTNNAEVRDSEVTSSKRARIEPAEDRHDMFCKYLAAKLRDIPNEQRLIAEKLINDVVFEAELGSLTLSHKVAKSSSKTNE